MIPCNQVVGFPCLSHGEQKGVKWIGSLNTAWQYIQNQCPLQIVDHGADTVGLQDAFEFWIAARSADFFQLRL